MASNISRYHGQVKKCGCGLADDPDKQQSLQACRSCFGRGFIAECTACDGKGRLEVPVNGSDPKLGVMSSTCSPCGGTGSYGVKRPEDWTEPVVEVAATA